MSNKNIIVEIDRYIKGKLSSKEVDNLWIKFLDNPEYFDWFETDLHLRHMIHKNQPAAIHSLRESNKPKKPNIKTWIAAAAAIIVLSVGLQYFWSLQSFAEEYAIDQIDRTELMGSDILRSDSQEVEQLDITINEALADAYEGEIEEAIAKFEKILEESPNSRQRVRAEMNLGILLYNESEYEQAVVHFQSITEMGSLSKFVEEKAWWFLGNTYLNLDQLDHAREAVFTAYSLDGRYKNPARDLLERLDIELGNVLPDSYESSSSTD